MVPMRHLSSATRWLLVSAAVAATVVGLAIAVPTSAHAEDSHVQYTWDQDVVTVRSTVPGAWGVRAAVRGWNVQRADGQPKLVVDNEVADPDVVIATVQEPGEWWTGLAEGTVEDGSLATFDISLNVARINHPEYRYEGSLQAAKYWTTSHELGHALGLEHAQDVKQSVMSYANPWWKTDGRPAKFDFGSLADIY